MHIGLKLNMLFNLSLMFNNVLVLFSPQFMLYALKVLISLCHYGHCHSYMYIDFKKRKKRLIGFDSKL